MGLDWISMLAFGVLERLGQSSRFLPLRLVYSHKKIGQVYRFMKLAITCKTAGFVFSRSKENRLLLHLIHIFSRQSFIL